MNWLTRIVFFLMVLVASNVVFAGLAEEANTVVDRWSAAYTSNDPEAVVKNYAPDAILLGTADQHRSPSEPRQPGFRERQLWRDASVSCGSV